MKIEINLQEIQEILTIEMCERYNKDEDRVNFLWKDNLTPIGVIMEERNE